MSPSAAPAASGGGGTFAAAGGKGSTIGSTHPDVWLVAVTAADEQIVAAGAPPLIAARTAQGSTCWGEEGVEAPADAELKKSPQTTAAPRMLLTLVHAITALPPKAGSFPEPHLKS